GRMEEKRLEGLEFCSEHRERHIPLGELFPPEGQTQAAIRGRGHATPFERSTGPSPRHSNSGMVQAVTGGGRRTALGSAAPASSPHDTFPPGIGKGNFPAGGIRLARLMTPALGTSALRGGTSPAA